MEPTRLFEFIEYQHQNAPLDKAFSTKYEGKWHNISSEEFINKSRAISRALVSMGIKAGDKIAMITSNNRSEWSIMDVGLLTLGAVNVPLYPTISSKDYEYILNHSESIYCFVSDQEVYDKVIAIKNNVNSLKKVLVPLPISSRIIKLRSVALFNIAAASVIKSQFGKSIYGEVIDKILRETSTLRHEYI